MRMFNRKRLIISGILLLLVVALLLLLSSGIFTYSRYETTVSSQNSITTAVYLLSDEYQTITVKLPDVIPGNGQYKYKFTVSNFKNDLHADTNIRYRIHMRTTTNMDIDYDLYNTFDIDNASTDIIDSSTDPDRFGTYFNHFYTDYKTMLYSENKTDYYTILFTFPTDFKEAKYSNVAELIEVNIESNQIIQGD